MNRTMILVIEDNPIARKLFRIALEVDGYTVREAADAAAAIALVSEELPALVIQDMVLPDGSGLELVSCLRMLAGSALIRAWGVRRALIVYAVLLIALSLAAWGHVLPGGKLAFALILPLLNGIPFGLMGAYFNEVFRRHRTMLSGAAYNLGRIAAGFSPFIITALGLNEGGNYFLFSSALGIGVLAVCWSIPEKVGETSGRISQSKERGETDVSRQYR